MAIGEAGAGIGLPNVKKAVFIGLCLENALVVPRDDVGNKMTVSQKSRMRNRGFFNQMRKLVRKIDKNSQKLQFCSAQQLLIDLGQATVYAGSQAVQPVFAKLL